MRIALFGASGKTGEEILLAAGRRGMQVTAYARSAARLRRHGPAVRVVEGELSDSDGVRRALHEVDAVLIALGQSRPWRRAPAIVEGVDRIITTAAEHGPARLIYLSALGVADGRADTTAIARLLVLPLILRGVYADHAVDEARIRASTLDWTIVRPNNLTSGTATGRYRIGPGLRDRFPIGHLSRADLAEAMINAIDDEAMICRTVNVVG